MTTLGDAAVAPLARPGIDAVGTLTATLPCRQCGYDLHGLHETGRCPECGVPVGLSLKGDLLQFSQPQWVQSLRLGVKLMLWSIVVTVVGSVLAFAVAIALRNAGGVANTIVIFIGAVISFVGSWQLTTPDPSGLGEDQYGMSRKLIRIGLAIGLANYALSFFMTSITLPPVPAIMLGWLSTGLELFALVGTFALLHYLSKLALRIPDNKLSARAKFLKYAMCGSQLLALIFWNIVARFLMPALARRGTQAFVLLSLFSGVIGLCSLVFAVMYLFLLLGFNKRLREAAASASLIWQTSPS